MMNDYTMATTISKSRVATYMGAKLPESIIKGISI